MRFHLLFHYSDGVGEGYNFIAHLFNLLIYHHILLLLLSLQSRNSGSLLLLQETVKDFKFPLDLCFSILSLGLEKDMIDGCSSTHWLSGTFKVTRCIDGPDSTLTCSAISSQTSFAFLYCCNLSFSGSKAFLSSSCEVNDKVSTPKNRVSLAGGDKLTSQYRNSSCRTFLQALIPVNVMLCYIAPSNWGRM